MPTRLESLAEIEAAVWRELAQAVRDKQHAWRLAVLATVDASNGTTADARSVVLRDLDAATRTLLIYTDARSPKAAQLAAHPGGALVLWSAALGWQLRLKVALTLETSGLRVSSRWARLKLTPAAQDYLSPLPPGAAIDGGGDGSGNGTSTSTATGTRTRTHTNIDNLAAERQSRDHFAVLAAQVQAVDWLDLHPEGHRRALFSAAGAVWVTP